MDTLNVFSDSWNDVYPENNPGSFIIPLEEPLTYYHQNTFVGVKLFASSGNFYNITRDDYIGVYITDNGDNFRFITTLVLPAGHYRTAEDLIDCVNAGLLSLPRYTEIKKAPKLYLEDQSVLFEPGKADYHQYDPDDDAFVGKEYKVVCTFPDFFYDDFKFDRNLISRKNQFLRRFIWSEQMASFKETPSEIKLWSNISEDPILSLQITDHIIRNDEITWVPYNKNYLGQNVDIIEFYFTTQNNIRLLKREGNTAISLLLKTIF